MDLPLDVKYMIASFDINVWIRLSYIDDEFKQFSFKEGKKLFIDLFTILYQDEKIKTWKIFDKYHSFNDQPAMIFANGEKRWYRNGQFHRDNDKPAAIRADSTRYWYQNGQLHRDNDQPAIVICNGDSKYWYQNNQLHRENDKPARIDADGTQHRYINGIFTAS